MSRIKEKCCNKKVLLILLAVICVLLLIGVIVLLVILLNGSSETPSDLTTLEVTTTQSSTTTTFTPYQERPRRLWSSVPDWSPQIDRMPHPISELFLGDTGRFGHRICSNSADCERDALSIEQEFLQYYPNFGDLPYNFMIPNLDMIFEGRGWRYDGSLTGNYTRGDRILFVAMMGHFNQFVPTNLQLDLLWSLVNEGVHRGYIRADYKIYAECQQGDITSPGNEFLHMIQGWDRWSNYSEKWQLNECLRF